MKQFIKLLLLTIFIMSSGLVTTLSYAEKGTSTEKCEGENCPECEGENCPEDAEPECD